LKEKRSQDKQERKQEKTYKLLRYRKKSRCEGSDSNARTPTRPGSQPWAFELAWATLYL